MWTPFVVVLAAGVLFVVRWSGAVRGSAQWGVSAAATVLLGIALLLAWRQLLAHTRALPARPPS